METSKIVPERVFSYYYAVVKRHFILYMKFKKSQEKQGKYHKII